MKKAIFLKSAVGVGFGYLEDEIAELNDKVFTDLKELGFVKEYSEPEPPEPVSDLPMDLPGRDKLISSGITLLSDIEKIDDLTQINGIGKKLNQSIHNFLKDKK